LVIPILTGVPPTELELEPELEAELEPELGAELEVELEPELGTELEPVPELEPEQPGAPLIIVSNSPSLLGSALTIACSCFCTSTVVLSIPNAVVALSDILYFLFYI